MSSSRRARERRRQRKQDEQRKWLWIGGGVLFAALVIILLVAIIPDRETASGDTITTDSGLQVVMIEEGTGTQAQPGDLVAVHYEGRLEDGTVFDSSYERGQPHTFTLGTGNVIAGWDEGIALLREGGQAQLIIPPELGYGELGRPPTIPPNATLIFDVELVEILN